MIDAAIIEKGKVIPYIQVIRDLKSSFYSYEVLGRLVVDEKVLSPGEFMPYLKPYRLREFDREVVAEMLAKAVMCGEFNSEPQHLHFNVSRSNLVSSDYVDFIQDIIDTSRYPAEFLTFEVVEDCLFWKDEVMQKTLHALHRLGVSLAIDDFPCWEDPEAVLSFLEARRLNFTFLKLDQSLTQVLSHPEFLDQRHNEALEYIQRAKAIGMKIIAEGVEKSEQIAVLEKLDIDAVQGFAIGRPAPACSVFGVRLED